MAEKGPPKGKKSKFRKTEKKSHSPKEHLLKNYEKLKSYHMKPTY